MVCVNGQCIEVLVPAGASCPPNSPGPISFFDGQVLLWANDVSAGGFGASWGHARSYNNQMSSDVDYGNGTNWLVYQWPYLLDDGATVIVVRGGQQSQWFNLNGDGSYSGQFGILDTLTFNSGTNTFTLANRLGTVETYGGFAAVNPGSLLAQTSPGGVSVSLTYASGQVSEMLRTYTDAAGVTTTESYLYDYIASGANAGHIASVLLRRSTSADGLWTNIRRALYTYYGSSSPDGNLNNLQTVTRQVPAGAADWQDESTDYYRYYAGTLGGSAGLLKYVLSPEGFARLATAVGNPLTAADEEVARFADSYFEYDSQRRVTREDVAGGTRTYTYAYAASSFEAGPNNWSCQTVETRPDGSTRTVFMNSIGQSLLDVVSDGTNSWITYQLFDANYNVLQIAEPSAINLASSPVYNPSVAGLAVQLNALTGLIRINDYTSGDPVAPDGYPLRSSIQQGTGGTPVVLEEVTYGSNTGAGGVTIYPVVQRTVYKDEAGLQPIVTSYAYTFYPGASQPLEKDITLPVISTDQNGYGTAAVRREQYDLFGNLVWEQGPRGFIDNFTFDPVTGAMSQMVEDVDPALLALPSGWSRAPLAGLPALPAPLNLVTDYLFDELGRRTQALGPPHNIDGVGVRTATWTVYRDAQHQVWTAYGYATGIAPLYDYTLVNPVSITENDLLGRPVDQIWAARASLDGPLTAGDTFDQTTWTAWTHQAYNDASQLVASRAYANIPATGCGELGVNYDETQYGYDSAGRRNRTVSPGGTITRTVFDAEGRPLGVYVGTNDDGATDTNPLSSVPTNNMRQTNANGYSVGCTCSQPDQQTVFVDDDPANNRVTTYTLDFRNRVATITDALANASSPLGTIQTNSYDNLNNLTQVDRTSTASGHLIARNQTLYDDQGRGYQSIRYAVDPASGAVGNALVDNNWYDEAGNLVKALPSGAQLFTKTFYDSQARIYATYQGYDTGSDPESYIEALQVTDTNKIFEQTVFTYDAAGNQVLTTRFQRMPGAGGYGPLVCDYSIARTTYQATWYDGTGRQTATANYGTNNQAPFTRPDSPPAPSDTALVNTFGYDPAGNQVAVTDPMGIVTLQTFNALSKPLNTISNYTGGSPGNATDVTVRMQYNADGNLIALTACNPTTGDQVTRFEYGVTLANADIASNELLRATVYGDAADSTDRVVQSYNRQGQLTSKTDQNGTVHQYDFDPLGRPTADKVTLPAGSAIDGSVLRIGRTYEVRGLPATVTSYADAAGTTVVNQIEYVYNTFQQLISEYQEHGGAVNMSSPSSSSSASSGSISSSGSRASSSSGAPITPAVQYQYADGSANTIRSTALVYPNGRTINYVYNSDDDDALSRISCFTDGVGGTTLVEYTYLGLADIVSTTSPEPTLASPPAPPLVWTVANSTLENALSGLDQFGRVIDCEWQTATGGEHIYYGHNRAGSRIWRRTTPSANQDELYAYDALQRLVAMARGTLSSDNAGVSDLALAQQWELDATGNWSEFASTDMIVPANSLDQQRTANPANEISGINQRYGAACAQPAYDPAGNMTTIPQPTTPTASFSATYDAWNRLTALAAAANYGYDGLNRRTTKTTGGSARDFYYSNNWQDVEERVGGSTSSDRQFILGLRYIDDLVLRDRASERLYVQQDANWNVTAVTDTSGDVQERYSYAAYGVPAVLNRDFSVRSGGSTYAWETLYSGYRWDSESELHHVRHRYLQPRLGTWSARDPVGPWSTDLNLYQYVAGNPVNDNDPSGLIGSMCAPYLCGGSIPYNPSTQQCCRIAWVGQTWGIFSNTGPCPQLPPCNLGCSLANCLNQIWGRYGTYQQCLAGGAASCTLKLPVPQCYAIAAAACVLVQRELECSWLGVSG